MHLATRYGEVCALEAKQKGVDIVLGPTINLHRSPLGGRHFECVSEDPELSGQMGAAYVKGLQSNGVAATPKHYVANDSETDRFTVDVTVDERALRELYLAPFERAVEAGSWAMMSAYNAVNGVTMTESDLLETPLNDEWGFDGVVISDWTAVRGLDSARASQDLAMPGPHTAWAELGGAIRDGSVEEADLDRKVLRMLLLAERVGALGNSAAPVEDTALDGVAFAREAAVAGSVLLTNSGLLPLDSAAPMRVAIIGEPARTPRTQGGGSATVIPEKVVSPLEALRKALPGSDVRYAAGAEISHSLMELPLAQLTNPTTGEPGLRVTFAGAAGDELFADDRRSSALVWFGGDVPLASSATLTVDTTFIPDADGEIEFGFASSNHTKFSVGGKVVIEGRPSVEGMDLGAAFLQPPVLSTVIAVRKNVPLELSLQFSLANDEGLPLDALSVAVGIVPQRSDADDLIQSATALASESDLAVVFVGTNSEVESEGYDRADLDLPGRQDDLVRAVVDANPRTIVVVNAGAPVSMPWADRAAAVILGYFGGQEFGPAIAEIITGAAEPGGRLPTTWPRALEDVPVVRVVPVDGTLDYSEGIHVGYRAWLRSETEPAFPFGHGLGYTDWSWRAVERDGDELVVTLANSGHRPGKNVIQVYAEREDSVVDRPVRWLVGFDVVTADPGETAVRRISIDRRALAHWDSGWRDEPGAFTLRVGGSLDNLPLTTSWVVRGQEDPRQRGVDHARDESPRPRESNHNA